jgi:Asp-tRNA(Asn)/Glu-tRNA(Gln) amidotransferase A subunit family amidase
VSIGEQPRRQSQRVLGRERDSSLDQLELSGFHQSRFLAGLLREHRTRVERQLSIAFETYDLIMTPSAAARPWKAEQAFPLEIAGQQVGPRGHGVFTEFVNLAGAAGINVPCGLSSSGLPVGLQLVSRPGGDGLLIGIASQCEAAGL